MRIKNKMAEFFEGVKDDDLKTLTEPEVDQKACCQTRKLAYELFRMAANTKGFPFNDPELMKRSQEEKLNVYQMRPFNEMAIKIMRRFGKLKNG